MNDLDLDALSRLRADVTPPSPATLAGVRALLGGGDRATVRTFADLPSRRRRVGFSVLAAAAVAACAVVLSLTSWAPKEHPAAVARPSHSAASPAASSHAAPAAAFTHITTHDWSISEAALKDRAVWYLSEGQDEQWVPSDWSQTWYWRTRANTAQHFLTSSDAEYVTEHAPELLQSETDTSSGKNGVPDADGHLMCGPGACTPGWDYLTTGFIASLPTDPTALRASLYSAAQSQSDDANRYHKTDDVDSQAFDFLAAALELGYLPADLQAALYSVATTIPGVTAVADETTLDGAHGVGLSRLDRFGAVRTDLIFTVPGGQLIGSRQVVTSSDWNSHNDSNTDPPAPITHVPAGTVIGESAVSVETVGSPPGSVTAR